jgi:hypothetical protein
VGGVRLFTPLSASEADQAARGNLRGEFLWVDKPEASDASADAVWMSIDVPDKRLHRFETREVRRPGCRQFLLPARVTNLHQAQRTQLPI